MWLYRHRGDDDDDDDDDEDPGGGDDDAAGPGRSSQQPAMLTICGHPTRKIEKNWSPLVMFGDDDDAATLLIVYSIDPLVVLEYDDVDSGLGVTRLIHGSLPLLGEMMEPYGGTPFVEIDLDYVDDDDDDDGEEEEEDGKEEDEDEDEKEGKEEEDENERVGGQENGRATESRRARRRTTVPGRRDGGDGGGGEAIIEARSFLSFAHSRKGDTKRIYRPVPIVLHVFCPIGRRGGGGG